MPLRFILRDGVVRIVSREIDGQRVVWKHQRKLLLRWERGFECSLFHKSREEDVSDVSSDSRHVKYEITLLREERLILKMRVDKNVKFI